MSGDLEDFLLRAARRRQDKVNEDQSREARADALRTKQQVQSQYSDRRSERRVQLDVDDVMEAEVIESGIVEAEIVQTTKTTAGGLIGVSNSTKGQQSIGVEASSIALSGDRSPRQERAVGSHSSNRSASRGEQADPLNSLELVELLGKPGGVHQALLLKEIIDRPTHRWE